MHINLHCFSWLADLCHQNLLKTFGGWLVGCGLSTISVRTKALELSPCSKGTANRPICGDWDAYPGALPGIEPGSPAQKPKCIPLRQPSPVQLCFGGLCATYDIIASVCAAFAYHKDNSNVFLFNNETEIRFVILGFILMYQKFANVIRSDIRI